MQAIRHDGQAGACIRMLIGVTRRQYDIGPDGRFLLNHTPAEPQSSGSITLVQNWSANLQ